MESYLGCGMIKLTDEEMRAMPPEREGDYTAGVYYYYKDGIRDGAKAQLKKVVELLEDAIENSFVMAYVGEDEPYESTIDPITIREIISDMRQALLKEVKE